MIDIVAVGEPLVEFNQARATDPHAYQQGFGGDTSNMAIAAARLGARVAYVTRLGNDGQIVIEDPALLLYYQNRLVPYAEQIAGSELELRAAREIAALAEDER